MEMHRSVYFFIILFSALFFVSCGDGGSNAQTTNLSAKTQYLSISKAPASSSVSIFQNVSLEFSAELNVSSVDSNTAYIMDSLGGVFGSEVEVDELDNSKITFIPHKYFSPDSSYTIVITTGIKDKLGRSLSENFYHLFSTQAEEVEIATLFVKSTKPSNNKIDIDPSSDFYLEFNRFVSQGNVAGNSVLELRNANGELVDGISKVFNSTISFIPTDELNTTQEYTLTLIDGVSDMFGNIYDADSNISSWNFTTTDAGFSYNKSGISRISEDDLGKSSYMIRTLKQTSTNSIVVIGTIRGIDLYKINYLIPFSKPSIEFLYSYELPSKVNALATFDDVYIIAGTKENGIYSFAAGESNLTEVSHFPSSESIYGISIGKTQGGIIDRAYAVGPKYGMGIFALYSNGVLETLTHVDQNNSIMIDALDATGYDEASMGEKRRIYVADYNDAMLVYDENGVLETKVDFNASIRKIVPLGDYNGVTGVAALSSTGIAKAFDLNASPNTYGDLELPLKVSSANTHIDYTDLTSKCFVSDKNRGIVLLDLYPNFYKDSVILYQDGVISSSVIKDIGHDISYLLGISENGKLGLYNIFADNTAPQVTSVSVGANDVLGSNATFSVTIYDEKLDFSTINSSNFELLDLNTTQSVPLGVNVSGEYQTATCTLTPQTQLEDKDYKLVIKSAISDIVGNTLSGGNYEVNFSAQTTPSVSLVVTLSGDTNVAEGSDATYTISLSQAASTDLTVDVNLTHISTLSNDISTLQSSYTIVAGSTSTNITLSTVDDNISDGVDIYSISLAGTSSGGNFDSINIDTTAVQTQIIDNDISSLSINDVMAYEDASVITFTVSMDKVAEEDVTFSYATSDTNTTVGSDYVAVSSIATIPAGSTSVDINVSISNDTLAELVELFVMTISNPSSNAVIADGSAIGSIYDEAIVMVSEDYNISEDSNFSVNLLANDIVDGGMNIENFDIAGIGNFSAGFTPVSIDVNSTTIGQVYLNTNGTFMYETILANYNGLLPEITYYTDVNTSATLNLFVENDNTDAFDDNNITTWYSSDIIGNALANDESSINSITNISINDEANTTVSFDAGTTEITGSYQFSGCNYIGIYVNSSGDYNVSTSSTECTDIINMSINYTTDQGSSANINVLVQGQALP